jgi:hypothetical protein
MQANEVHAAWRSETRRAVEPSHSPLASRDSQCTKGMVGIKISLNRNIRSLCDADARSIASFLPGAQSCGVGLLRELDI